MITHKIDKAIFIPSLITIISVCIVLCLNPEDSNRIIATLLSFTTHQLGYIYLWFGAAALIFLIWMAFGKYGQIKLGAPDDKPEFSTSSWIMMLFCAGIGSSVMYWGCIEWVYYYKSPPFGIGPKSIEAGNYAAMYGLFHWGLIPWVIYCIPTLPMAYSFYVRKHPGLRMSSACRGMIGHHADGIIGKIIDVFFIFGLIGGVGTTLGLGTPMISEGLGQLLGIERTFTLDVTIILIWTAIFATSVYLGLEKGIKRLSDFNVWLGFGLIIFIILVGPTVFIFSTFTNSIGLLLNKFTYLCFHTDPIGNSGFPQSWTVFYWAWWIAYAPFMGLFVTKISKGRTIKELILGECLWGSLGCWLFFAVFGNTGLYFEINNILPVTTILTNEGAAVAIISILKTLPMGSIILFLFIILAFVYSATTIDSAAYTLAAVSTKNIKTESQPARWHRLFWAFILAGVALSLMYLGGLKVLQTSVVVTAFPILFIILLSIFSLLKLLKEDYPDK